MAAKEIKPCREPWGGTMTARERFNNQLHYKPVDRCFNMEFGYWDENFLIWDIFVRNGITNNQEADIFFSFDRIGGAGGNIWMYPPFEDKVIGEKGDKLIIQNGDGLTAEIPRDRHDTIPHYINSAITTPEDWKRVKEERFRRDDPARKIDVAALKAAAPDDRDFPFGIYCGSMIGRIRDMLTFEGVCYISYDYPDMLEDMVETACVLAEDSLDQVLPHVRFDYASGWEDICYKQGPILSVDFFRSVVAPRYKRIDKKLKEYGIDIWYTDCDGDVRPLLPIFLESGINCLFPFEVNCCTHPGELLDQYGGELRIMGGVDKIVLKAGREEIDAYLKTLEPYVARGGYIPFCDHLCPPDIPEDNYLYYLDLKKKMFA